MYQVLVVVSEHHKLSKRILCGLAYATSIFAHFKDLYIDAIFFIIPDKFYSRISYIFDGYIS